MSKKRDTHKGNSLGLVRKGSAPPRTWTALFILGSSLTSGCARSSRETSGPTDAELRLPATTSPTSTDSAGGAIPPSTNTSTGTKPSALTSNTSAASAEGASASNDQPTCPSYGKPEHVGTIEDPKLNEISGIVAAAQPGSFWVHNDSGDGPNVYLVGSDGKRAATFGFAAATVMDVEDMARAPRAAGGFYLYLADIGDNGAARRDGVTLLRAREPDVGAPPQLPAEVMRVTYPGGPSDAEAFLVDPLSGELVIVTKHPLLPARVLATKEFSALAELRELGSITPESSGQAIAFVTGAAVSSDGRFALLRTYEAAYLFARRSGQTLGQALLGPACRIETAPERQGEAITFVPATRAAAPDAPPPFVTVSEGMPTTLWRQSPE